MNTGSILPGVTHEQAMEYAAEVIHTTLPALEERRITLALEPLGPSEGNFLLTAGEAVELIDRVNSPFVRLHLDVKAMSSEPTPIPEIIRSQRGHLAHFHANDPNRQGPGFGDVDFHPICKTLLEIDYQGWVSVEVFDYSPGIERLTRQSIEYLKQCFAEVASAT